MKIKTKHINQFLEFFIVGMVMGVVEDLIAIKLITNEPFSWHVLWIVALVALPFAIFSELVADREDFQFIREKKKKRQ